MSVKSNKNRCSNKTKPHTTHNSAFKKIRKLGGKNTNLAKYYIELLVEKNEYALLNTSVYKQLTK